MILLLVGAFSALHAFLQLMAMATAMLLNRFFVFRSVPFQNSRPMPRVAFSMDLLSSLALHASRSAPSPELSS